MRVLIVQTQPLGDAILTTGLLREAARVASAPVDVVAAPAAADLLASQPWCGAVHRLDKRGGPSGIAAAWTLGRRLAEVDYDAVLAVQRSHRSGLIARLTGAPCRVGYRGAPGRWAYTHHVPRDPSIHAARRPLELLLPLGVDTRKLDASPEVVILGEVQESNRQRRTRLPNRRWIALAPGTARATKRWPTDRWIKLGIALEDAGYGLVLFGGSAERDVARDLRQRLPGVVDLVGVTTPLESADLLRSAALVVAHDSAAGHLASAVGTRVVTLYGPTAPSMGFQPWGAHNVAVEVEGLDCRPCHRTGPHRCPLRHHRCMKDLGVAAVQDAVERVLAD